MDAGWMTVTSVRGNIQGMKTGELNFFNNNYLTMRIYISGKIGEEVISEATRQKFARAEAMLKAKGYEVFNPCDERWQKTLKREYEGDSYVKSPWLAGKFPDFYAYVLLRDLMVLSTKDAAFFLYDWDNSPGAQSEHSFAMATGKKLLWERLEDALVFHDDNEKPEDIWLPLE